MCPNAILCLEALPHNEMGKLQRLEIPSPVPGAQLTSPEQSGEGRPGALPLDPAGGKPPDPRNLEGKEGASHALHNQHRGNAPSLPSKSWRPGASPGGACHQSATGSSAGGVGGKAPRLFHPIALIRRAELLDGRIVDVRIADGRISAVGTFQPEPLEPVIDAEFCLLLPGLHDHHIHVAAAAAALASVRCGPPEVRDLDGLAARLRQPGTGWLRGVAYHESVAGLIDRDWLDRAVSDRPVRIQHRSGRLWILQFRRALSSGQIGIEGAARIGA